MNISLTPELDRAVQEKVALGLYRDASEVVQEALRVLLAQEHESRWLQRETALGFAQLEAGETVVVESREAFAALLRAEE